MIYYSNDVGAARPFSRSEARGLTSTNPRVRLLAEHPERGDGACADSAKCRVGLADCPQRPHFASQTAAYEAGRRNLRIVPRSSPARQGGARVTPPLPGSAYKSP